MEYYRASFGFGRPWTPAVKGLIIANGAVFLLQLFGANQTLQSLLGLDTGLVLARLMIWQLVTYMFLHGGVFHLLFNMFALWMFGSEIEDRLGRREFLFYYFLTGVGAGLSVLAVDAVLGWRSLTIGASGAVYGVLLAYGLLFARRQITLLVFFVLPVTLEARVFVAVFAVLELLWGVSGQSGIAHFAHLGGMLVGWIYFKLLRDRLRPALYGKPVLGALRDRWRSGSEQSDQERLDQILDKINRFGIHTLTDGERRFLEKMSTRAH